MAFLKEQQLNPMPHRIQLEYLSANILDLRRTKYKPVQRDLNLKSRLFLLFFFFFFFFVPRLLIFIFVQNILLVCFHKKKEIAKLWECVHLNTMWSTLIKCKNAEKAWNKSQLLNAHAVSIWTVEIRFVYVFTVAAVTNASCGMLPLVSLE